MFFFIQFLCPSNLFSVYKKRKTYTLFFEISLGIIFDIDSQCDLAIFVPDYLIILHTRIPGLFETKNEKSKKQKTKHKKISLKAIYLLNSKDKSGLLKTISSLIFVSSFT